MESHRDELDDAATVALKDMMICLQEQQYQFRHSTKQSTTAQVIHTIL